MRGREIDTRNQPDIFEGLQHIGKCGPWDVDFGWGCPCQECKCGFIDSCIPKGCYCCTKTRKGIGTKDAVHLTLPTMD